MERKKLRKIVVNNKTYLWRREHLHLVEYEHSACMERVIIYLAGYKNSPLHLYFREEDNLILEIDVEQESWQVGSSSQGIIWLYKRDSTPSLPVDGANPTERQPPVAINLSRPAVIAKLVEYFTRAIWKPTECSKPVVVEDGLRFLEALNLPLGV